MYITLRHLQVRHLHLQLTTWCTNKVIQVLRMVQLKKVQFSKVFWRYQVFVSSWEIGRKQNSMHTCTWFASAGWPLICQVQIEVHFICRCTLTIWVVGANVTTWFAGANWPLICRCKLTIDLQVQIDGSVIQVDHSIIHECKIITFIPFLLSTENKCKIRRQKIWQSNTNPFFFFMAMPGPNQASQPGRVKSISLGWSRLMMSRFSAINSLTTTSSSANASAIVILEFLPPFPRPWSVSQSIFMTFLGSIRIPDCLGLFIFATGFFTGFSFDGRRLSSSSSDSASTSSHVLFLLIFSLNSPSPSSELSPESISTSISAATDGFGACTDEPFLQPRICSNSFIIVARIRFITVAVVGHNFLRGEFLTFLDHILDSLSVLNSWTSAKIQNDVQPWHYQNGAHLRLQRGFNIKRQFQPDIIWLKNKSCRANSFHISLEIRLQNSRELILYTYTAIRALVLYDHNNNNAVFCAHNTYDSSVLQMHMARKTASKKSRQIRVSKAVVPIRFYFYLLILLKSKL